MTYHAVLEPSLATPVSVAKEAKAANCNFRNADAFNRLEWGVIHSAREDRLWTIRPLGRLRRFLNWVLNVTSFELANERLEALRKAAVLSWHYGYSIPGHDVADFLAAGFSPGQYELMVNGISDARTPPARFA